MSKFKIGDKIRYVREGAIDWESSNYAESLIIGDEYTVSRVYSPDSTALKVLEKGTYWIHEDHFEFAINKQFPNIPTNVVRPRRRKKNV